MAKIRRFAAMPLPVLVVDTTSGFTCAVTAPAPGVTVNVGTPVTVTVTTSASASGVDVYVAGVFIAAMTGSGTSWSYSWTPITGQIGSAALQAVAVKSGTGAVVASPPVTVTVAAAAAVSPLVTMAGNVKQMLEAATSATTGTWTDQSPSAANHVWAGPCVIGSDGGGAYVSTPGTSYGSTTLTLAAPGTTPLVLDVIVQQDAYVLNGPLFCLGGIATCAVVQTASGVVKMANGSNITGVSFALGAFKRVRCIFTGATSGTADSIKIGGAAAVTGFAGNTAPSGGYYLGATGGTFFTGKFRAAYLYSAIPSGPQATALDDYYVSKYGASILT